MRDFNSASVCGPRNNSTAEERRLLLDEREVIFDSVTEPVDGTTVGRQDRAQELLVLETLQRRAYVLVGVRGDGLTAGRLVASLHQRGEGERVVLRRRQLLFDHRAEHALFFFVEVKRHQRDVTRHTAS